MFKKIIKGCGVAIAVLFLVVIALFAALYFTAPDRFNVLVVGTDQRGEERSRSDVLMVLSVPKSPSKQATLLTIPRDTYVEIPGHGMDKITHAYVYGEKKDPGSPLGNIDLTQETVEDFLDIKINAVIEFNFESFREIVDLLGGVEIDGRRVLGEEALGIVRNRYREGGDFARTEDQRDVLQSVLAKASSPGAIRSLIEHVQDSDNARLQYSNFEVARFGGAYVLRRFSLKKPEIVEEVVPGAGARIYTPSFGQELYYWKVDDEAFDEIKEKGFN